MTLDKDTRFWIGALATAVVLVVGYGVYRELNRETPVTPLPVSAPVASTTIQAAAEPGAPALQIQGEPTVIGGTGGHTVSVSGEEGLRYEWTIQGGTFEGDATGPAVTWTAGEAPSATVTCRATNAAGKSSIVSLRIQVQQPPVITTFEATPAAITAGSAAKLNWSVRNAEKLTLEPMGQDVSQYKGPAIEVKPQETTTYVLKGTNATGVTVTREVQVKVIAEPTIGTFKADPAAGSSSAFEVTAEFKGGKAELKQGDTVLTSSETSPLRFRAADLKDGAALTLRVTNEAGSYVTATLTFTAKK